MRSLQRNRQTIWYRLLTGDPEPITETDEWGNVLDTGENTQQYSDPVEMKINVSQATGAAITEQFGNLDNYDKVLVTTQMDCPINGTTLLYIDTTPTQTNGTWSPHDYVVRRVAKSINGISIAVRKVDVS